MSSLEDRIGASLTPRGEKVVAALKAPKTFAEWGANVIKDHKMATVGIVAVGLALAGGIDRVVSDAHNRDELNKRQAIELALSSPDLQVDKAGNALVNDGSKEISIPVHAVTIPKDSTLSQELVAAGIQGDYLQQAETEAGGQLGNGPNNAMPGDVVYIPEAMFVEPAPAK